MAEPQKGTSSTAHSKEGTSLLDDEIGKDFLTSWKSTTAEEDDAFDFNCEMVTKGKKKTFNFDKLDMDFALDGGFDKISSFKIDMSDLDFSSPPRKAEKQKERSGKESILGRQDGKSDRFTFSFDFNGLDGFDLDSSLLKVEKKSDKNTVDEGLRSSVKHGKDQDSMSNSATSGDTFGNSDTKKLPLLDNATTSRFVLPKDIDTSTGGSPSISENLGNQDCLHDATSPEKQITTFGQESRGECHNTVKNTEQSETPRSKEPCGLNVIQDITAQPVSGNDSVPRSGPELRTGVSSLCEEVSTSPRREPDNSLQSVGSLHSGDSSATSSYNLQYSLATGIIESKGTDTEFQKYTLDHSYAAKENSIGNESAQANKSSGTTAMTSVSQKLPDATVAIENPCSVSKAPLQLHIDSTVDKQMPLKEKEIGVICSKFFSKSGDTESQSPSASAPSKVSLCNKRLEWMHLGPQNRKSPKFIGKGRQGGDRKFGISESDGKVFTKAPVIPEEETNDKELGTSSDSKVDESVPLKGKATGDIHSKYFSKSEDFESQMRPTSAPSRVSLCNKKLEWMHLGRANTKSPKFGGSEKQDGYHKVGISETNSRISTKAPVMTGSEKNNEELDSVGFQVHPPSLPEQTAILGTPRRGTSKLVVPSINPMRNSKIISMEKNKITPLGSDIKSFDFSGSHITSAMASKNESSNVTFQKEIKSLKQPEKNTGMLLNTAPKMAPSINLEKCALMSPSLKRKSLEGPCCDQMNLNPLKRAIETHSESRNVPESSQRIEEKVILDIDNPDDRCGSVLFDHPIKSDVPPDQRKADLKVPEFIGSDGSVEKAEACAKELEAICNMLKKKQDEAKEVLVRAIVNNNLLLMLYHPTYEEKISLANGPSIIDLIRTYSDEPRCQPYVITSLTVGKIFLCFLHHQNIQTIQRSAASILSKKKKLDHAVLGTNNKKYHGLGEQLYT